MSERRDRAIKFIDQWSGGIIDAMVAFAEAEMQHAEAPAPSQTEAPLEITAEKMKRLYEEGKVQLASEWISKQHDPFEIIAEMQKAGNLALLLAHYKEPIEPQAAQTVASPHPEDFCNECGGANPYCWFAPNDVWNELVPKISGILCPNCFMKRNPNVAWKVEPEILPFVETKWTPAEIKSFAAQTVASPRIRCEICGYFVETTGHASDCGNTPTKQEVDLLLSDSQTVASPTAEEVEEEVIQIIRRVFADEGWQDVDEDLSRVCRRIAADALAGNRDYAATLEARVAAQKNIISTLGEGKAAAEERAERAEAENLLHRDRWLREKRRADALAVSLRDVGETLTRWKKFTTGGDQGFADDTELVEWIDNELSSLLSRLSTDTKTGDNHER